MKGTIAKKGAAILTTAVAAFCLVAALAGCTSSAGSQSASASSASASASAAASSASAAASAAASSASAAVSAAGSSASAAAKISMTDIEGVQVEVPYQPKSMLMNWPGGLSVVLMFDQGDNMAAYMSAVTKGRYAWMQKVAPAIKTKPTADNLTAEEALNQKADLVIVRTGKEAEQFRNANIPTIAMQQDNVDELKQVVEKYGELFGMQDHAKAYIDYLEDTIKLINDRIGSVPESERPVVYTMNTQHGAVFTYTDGTKSVTEDYFTTAGGILATKDTGLTGLNAEISVEQIVELNPDIIVVTGGSEIEVYNNLLADETLSKLPAVANGKVYLVPSGIHTWTGTGPESALYMMWLAKTFYPDKFADIDMSKRIQDFYEQFYHTKFTDDEIKAIEAGYNSLKDYQEASK